MSNKTIYKYPVAPGYFSHLMPKGAEILTMQLQRDQVQMWALVNIDKPFIERKFLFVGTGHNIVENNLKYISTIQLDGGDLIFHLFEIL